jgi:hypothetical protein
LRRRGQQQFSRLTAMRAIGRQPDGFGWEFDEPAAVLAIAIE